MKDAEQLLAHKKHYEVKYDVDLLPSGDAMSVRLCVLVNSEGVLPGYRLQCTVQSDYRHRDYPQDISVDLVIPKDLGFLIMSTYDSMQDQLLALTGEMPLGVYILPPPDLNGSIRHKLREFLDLGSDEGSGGVLPIPKRPLDFHRFVNRTPLIVFGQFDITGMIFIHRTSRLQ